jgi:hypothetical protein
MVASGEMSISRRHFYVVTKLIFIHPTTNFYAMSKYFFVHLDHCFYASNGPSRARFKFQIYEFKIFKNIFKMDIESCTKMSRFQW